MRRLLAAVLVLLLAGCGIPEDEAPRALEREEAPFRVFEPSEEPTPAGDQQVQLYFVRDETLVPVERAIPSPVLPSEVLDLLFSGLTEPERGAGLRNAIPTALTVEDVDVRDRVAVVSLESLNEQVQVLAFAQIVATLDALEEVSGVRFRADGRDVQVPRGDGSLTDEPVNREAYAQLLGLAPQEAMVVPPTPATG